MIERLRLAPGALLLVVTAACASDFRTAPTMSAAAPPVPVSEATPAQPADAPVVARARRALAETGIDAQALKFDSVTETQWSDSSLGCRRPGQMYLQVITDGHVVRFAGGEKTYEVRVAGDNAVICGPGPAGVARDSSVASRARNLDQMVEQARTDLAARLGAKPDQIEVRNLKPTVWPDAGLDCEATPESQSKKTAGYKLYLTYAGRVFTYHTDMQRAIPCPPIESE